MEKVIEIIMECVIVYCDSKPVEQRMEKHFREFFCNYLLVKMSVNLHIAESEGRE